jgi:methylamine---glutamate N-methyltransferase subunit B
VGVVDCDGRSTREINAAIRELAASGDADIHVRRPAARHNLGVGLTVPVRLVFEGSVGYYCGGMGDGPTIEVQGSAGWGAAECILGGTVVIEKNAGAGVAAAIRGGTVVVRGDVSARGGISMKGGTLVIGGNAGYMTGFMMQKGIVIILGDTGEALGDSLYEGRIWTRRCGRSATTPHATISGRLSRGDACGTSTRRTSTPGRWRYDACPAVQPRLESDHHR